MMTRLPALPIAASLLLHAAMATPFLLPGKSGVRMTEVAFLDLSADAPSILVPRKPTATPKTEVKPKRVPPKEKRVMTKVPVAPVEKTPEEETPSPLPQETEETAPEEVATLPEAQVPLAAPVSAQNDLVLGLSRGFFQTLGKGRTLHPEVRDYYMAMLERVNRRWWGEAVDHRTIRREVLAVVIIGREGHLLNGWIARSSGDPSLDQVVLNTIREAAPFPPLPEEFATDYFQAPIRLVPPVASDPAPADDGPPHGAIPVPPT